MQLSCVDCATFSLLSFLIHRLGFIISSCLNILSLDVLHSFLCFSLLHLHFTYWHALQRKQWDLLTTTTCWETLDSYILFLQKKLKAFFCLKPPSGAFLFAFWFECVWKLRNKYRVYFHQEICIQCSFRSENEKKFIELLIRHHTHHPRERKGCSTHFNCDA